MFQRIQNQQKFQRFFTTHINLKSTFFWMQTGTKRLKNSKAFLLNVFVL